MKRLETERLKLREWKESDSKDLFEYASSDLVGPNAGWKPHKDENESQEIIKMFIQAGDTCAIELKSENKVIGGIGIHKRNPDDSLKDLKQRELGFVLNPKYWGNGYIPEAVERMIEYGFKELDLDLIWCGHYDFNERSKRVCQKCGFKYKFNRNEKIKLLDNKEVNILYYNLSKKDYDY
ncbi:acetyltransferase, GNAT family [Gottschalkia acidurici 9a]|uniref:Acetyltransferase, GNAT family n=1 Tax=Gottschalkia acidurici (strain ATCC 7906 / DSM 604 / BCRC 14475 / CIP 104303 / KCTC 5404 / NCIMB 10678 / 9a) TaxID=1128398 RepID=K0AZS8_GOTA9|nr:GNAT family N-acetyltransferase [Gottschalkia acidurici]AFS79303.1 acetyltransferase, GNAT family [Gottschalkia acidurici 9a]